MLRRLASRLSTIHRARADADHRDDSGAVLVLVATFMALAMTATAFAVDMGRLTDRKRELQSLADLVAIDAARAIEDGVATKDIYGKVDAAARASAARNGFLSEEVDDMTVLVGHWVDATRTFLAYSPDDPVTGLLVPDAVRVLATDAVDYAFAPLTGRPTRLATAVHRFAGEVCPTPAPSITTTTFSVPGVCTPPPTTPTTTPGDPPIPLASSGLTIGSFLARAEPAAGVLGPVLAEYFGVAPEDVVITAVGYEGLARSVVALDALRAALGFGTVTEMLDADIAVPDLLEAMATVLAQDGTLSDTDINGLVSLANRVDGATSARLGDVIFVATGHEDAAATGAVDALSLLMAIAMLSDGDSFIDVDLTGVVPGFSTARLRATVIEPPVTRLGPAGLDASGNWLTSAETAQVEVELVLGVDVPLVGRVEIPITLQGADAVGSLTRVACPPGGPDESTIAVDTSALDATAGPIVTALGATLAQPTSTTVSGAYDDLDFVWPDGVDAAYETVGTDTPELGIGAALVGSVPMLGDVTNDIDIAVEMVTSALGMRVGGADVIAYQPICSSVELV